MESPSLSLISIEIVFIFLCIGLNALFVIAEFSIVKVRPSRIQELVDAGNRRAYLISKIQEDLEGYLSATQLGITMMSMILGWLGEPALTEILKSIWPADLPVSEVVTHSLAVAIAFSILTFIQIVFAELVPRGLAIRNAERMALWIAPALFAIRQLFKPLLFIFDRTAKVILRFMGVRTGHRPDEKLSEEELRLVILESVGKGQLSDAKVDLIDNVFNFSKRTARHVMVNRDAIVTLDINDGLEVNIQKAKNSGHTRFPLCDGTVDNVVGLINVKDILWQEPENVDLLKVRREILFVPENKPLSRLLKDFQRNKIHMAIVIDEFAVVVGLVTLEDVLEELVGEIQDEYDQEAAPIQLMRDGTYIIEGSVLIEEVEEKLNVIIEKEGNTTIGGAIMSKLGRIPKIGDVVDFGDFSFVVKSLKGKRILTAQAIKKVVQKVVPE